MELLLVCILGFLALAAADRGHRTLPNPSPPPNKGGGTPYTAQPPPPPALPGAPPPELPEEGYFGGLRRMMLEKMVQTEGGDNTIIAEGIQDVLKERWSRPDQGSEAIDWNVYCWDQAAANVSGLITTNPLQGNSHRNGVGTVDNRGVWTDVICDAHPPPRSCATDGGSLLQSGPGRGGEDKNCALLFAPVEEARLYGPGDPRVEAATTTLEEIRHDCTNFEHLPYSVSFGAACIQNKALNIGYAVRGVVVAPQDGHGATQAGLVYYMSAIDTVQLEADSDVPIPGPTLLVAVLGPRDLPDP